MRVYWFASALALLLAVSLVVDTTPAAVPTLATLAQSSERAGASHSRSSTVFSEIRRGLAYSSDWYRILSNELTAKRTPEAATNIPPRVKFATLLPPPFVLDPPSNLTVTATANTSISLSWVAPAGMVNNYQVERSQNPSGLFTVVGSPAVNTFNDTTVSSGNAYLYRIRAVAGGIPSSPSNMAVGTAITYTDNPLSAGVTPIKGVHISELRQSINAVRTVAGLSAASWTDTSLPGTAVKAVHLQEMRDKVNEALASLSVPITAYTDPVLATGASGTPVKKVHIEELRQRASRSSSTSSGSPGGDTSTARLDPLNATGAGNEDPLSRNFNWTTSLVNLPGRADLDLTIALTYNSLVWTKSGTSISFDDDRGFPSPGFRLGFPVIQPLFFNSETSKWAYLLITTSGSRVELRQVGGTALYESADSSHMLLDTSTNPMVLRTTDGTQLSYVWQGSDFQCTQIKDRNGNFITINYTGFGRIDTVVDTLQRSVKFNYDGNQYLTSITQTWKVNGSNVTHNWATFAYSSPDLTINTNFTGLTKVGPPNGSTLKVLKSVTLANNARFDFDYTSWGQIWKVSGFATDGSLLNYRSYDLPLDHLGTPWGDCPRFTKRRDLASNWNRSGGNGLSGLPFGAEQEVVTSYAEPAPASWTPPNAAGQSGMLAQVTFADFTGEKVTQKIHYAGAAGGGTGWQRGLATYVETLDSAGALRKQVVTTWTQDNTNVPYLLNPRVTETNVYDPTPLTNRARTTTTYQTVNHPDGTSCALPQDVTEYQANATTVLRRSRTEYNLNAEYTNRRIIGLVSDRYLYEFNLTTQLEVLMSKQKFEYDESGSIVGNDQPVQHDNSGYTSSFPWRGNLSSIKRYDVTNTSLFVTTSSKYNTAGGIVESTDGSGHVTTMSYADAFAANGTTLDPALGFTTLAYPTSITSPGGFISSLRYYYDFGGITWNQTPQTNTATYAAGPQQKIAYDSIGRIDKITNLVNNAYTRYVFGPNYVETIGTVNTVADESRKVKVFDGLGRIIAMVGNHPNSTGGYSAELTLYDVLGRSIKESNTTETTFTLSGFLQPYNWEAKGDDSSWIYTQQSYDWAGRPRITTASDGTTKEATYVGNGDAGGEVTTLSSEIVLLPPQSGAGAFGLDRRKQKMYSDVLGRTWKVEMLNRDATPYMTTVTEYNARDQVTAVKEYKGAATSDGSCPLSTCQLTTSGYDGHARLSSNHRPEQNAGTATTWLYNADDTIQKVTDARGASETYTYNSRHLVTSITYAWPGGGTIPSPVTLAYDGAGNRTSMTDNTGTVDYHYDALSRMDWEQRNFASLGSTVYRLSYTYNLAGNLTSLTEPTQFGASVTYGYDTAGRMNSVTGSGLAGGVTNIASNVKYRAWGDMREMDYGNGLRLNRGYNSNMLISSHQVKVPGTPVGEGERARSTYEYEADGRIKTMADLTDGNFGRSYLYDHVGRLIDAHTASPAYFQSFTYDEFDHMTGRNNGSYRHSDWTVSNWQGNRNTSTTVFPPSYPSCCPPQPVFWTYNADGEVTHDHNKEYTYDAAGNTIRVFETTDIGISLVNKLWIFQDYDSDGNRVKRVEQEQQNFGPFTFVTTYFLRSSVLEDAVVIELDQNGGKRRAYIFANGEALAQQENNQVRWVHIDPVTASVRETATDGTVANRVETDPMGNGVALVDPEPPEVQTPDYIYPGTYEGSGNPYDGPSGCTLDGQPLPCSFVMGFVNIGAAAQCPDNRCGPRHNGSGWEFWDPDGGWQKRGKQKPKPPVLKKAPPRKKRSPRRTPKPKPKPEPPKKPGPKTDPEAVESTKAVDGQLSPCLRNALRQFFPSMTAQGQSHSPVDEARFKNWIPSRFKAAAKLPLVEEQAAITLGLYDIHYDPQVVDISGGNVTSDFFSLETIIEEISHTVQFLQVWDSLQRDPVLEFVGVNTTGYGAAKRRWGARYIYYGAKGFGYDNDVERWAKKRTAEIVTSLRANAPPDRPTLCGFRLY